MATHRQQVEDYIDKDLPDSFASSTISEMCAELEKDINLVKTKSPGTSQRNLEAMLHQRHKKLAFSYPGLFFKIVRREIDPEMLKSLLSLKESLDKQDMSLDAARNRVIDYAKNQIDSTEGKARVKKAKPSGTVVQELSFKCKPDDS